MRSSPVHRSASVGDVVTRGPRRALRRFAGDSSGFVTIEFVLWMPLVAFILVIAVDASMAFMRQSHQWQVSREAARIVSRYGMTEAQAEAYVASEAAIGDVVPTVDVRFNLANVIVETSMPIEAMTPFGTLNFVAGDKITSRVTHTMEPL